jgi:RNA polymerase sigma-70 factor (ECF subfamily)
MLAPDEQELIRRAKAGDQIAFERLLEPTVRSATRLAFSMLHDRSEAEDVFQESALRAWRRLGNLRVGSSFQPWFMGILANQCREIRRGRWWQMVRLPEPASAGPADIEGWHEGEDLRRAVSRLPHDQRVAVLLHFQLDMSLADVAVALGLSPGGVKNRINRALKRLRPSLTVSEVSADG